MSSPTKKGVDIPNYSQATSVNMPHYPWWYEPRETGVFNKWDSPPSHYPIFPMTHGELIHGGPRDGSSWSWASASTPPSEFVTPLPQSSTTSTSATSPSSSSVAEDWNKWQRDSLRTMQYLDDFAIPE